MTWYIRICAAVLAVSMLASQAWADGSDAVISVTIENDMFGGTDRNYSNGLRVERFSEPNRVHPWLKRTADFLPFIDVDRAKLRQGIGLSHAIYTPEDISLRVPDPVDRPYAAWLNISGTVIARDNDVQDSLQVNIGMIGPSAVGKFVQTNWHDVIRIKKPKGWAYQLKDEPGIEIIAEHQRRFDGPILPGNIETDIALSGGLALGNIRTYASTGAMMRLGFDLDADFGPPRIRPSLSGGGAFAPGSRFGGYVFVGAEGRAIARDIFLDGNTFRDGPRVENRSPLVADLTAGIALHGGDVQVAFTYVHRTEQFRAQAGPQRFGAVSISIAR